MANATSPFGKKLDDAIQHISKRKKWSRKAVYIDIGHELIASARTVESWKYKTLPDQGKQEKLARYLFTHGRDLCNREWLKDFLALGGHERPAALLNELFPIAGPPPRPVIALPSTNRPPIPFHVAEARPDFMGREAEMAKLAGAIDAGKRLCVIHGLPGVGRLTLASEYAQAHRAGFPGGAVTVSVALPAEHRPARDSQLLGALEDLAEKLGVDLSGSPTPAGPDTTPKKQLDEQSQRFKQTMLGRTSRVVIILEDILSREECDYFLPPRPSSHVVIVTSPSLDPGVGADLSIHLESFIEGRLPIAVDLLAAVIGPEIVDRVADAPALTDIATYVDGLPFALWFTGETIKADPLLSDDGSLTLAEYNDVILHLQDNRFTTLEERLQELLRACYERLSEPLQRCLAVLGVFEEREFSYEAAAAAMTENGQPPMVNWSRDLRKHSLLEFNRRGRRMVDGQPATRLSLHSLVRRLAGHYFSTFGAQEQEAIRNQAAWFHIDLAAEVAEQVADGRRHDFAPLILEWPNVQAAMRWFGQQRNAHEFQRGLTALTRPSLGSLGFLEVTGRWNEANEWLKEAYLLAARERDTDILPQLHFIAGVFALRRADYDLARNRLEDAATGLAALTDERAEQRLFRGQIYQYLGEVLTKLEDWKGALDALDKSEHILSGPATPAAYERGYTDIRRGQPLFQTSQDAVTVILRGLKALPPYPTAAHVSGALTLGNIYNFSNMPDEAIAAWDAGLPYAEALGDVRRTADLWRNKTNVQAEFGQLERAVAVQTEWYAKYKEMGDATGEGEAASNLGLAYLGLKKYDESRQWLDKAMTIGVKRGLEGVQAHAAINLTRWHIQQGDYAAAAVTLRRAGDAPFQQSEAQRLRAELALHEGDGEAALAAAGEAIQAIRSRADAGSAHRVLAAIQSRLGHVAEADAAYDQALAIFDGNPYETALTQLSRAAHRRRGGEEAEATALEREAAAALAELGLEPPDVVL